MEEGITEYEYEGVKYRTILGEDGRYTFSVCDKNGEFGELSERSFCYESKTKKEAQQMIDYLNLCEMILKKR